jgi:hypothetical protein
VAAKEDEGRGGKTIRVKRTTGSVAAKEDDDRVRLVARTTGVDDRVRLVARTTGVDDRRISRLRNL